jgi:hypothetical protein
MLRQQSAAYDTAPKGPGAHCVFHASVGWNAFGCVEPIREFLKRSTKRVRHVQFSDDLSIRMRVLFGIFRSANVEGLGNEITSLVQFRGLILFLAEEGISNSILFVERPEVLPPSEDLELFPKDQSLLRAGGAVPDPRYVAQQNYPRMLVEYAARSVDGLSFEDLPRLTGDQFTSLVRLGMTMTLKGENGADYKCLRRLDSSEDTTMLVASTRGWGGIPSVRIEVGNMPIGRPA